MSKVKQTAKRLNESLKSSRFDQLLAIGESKALIFRFLIWLQYHMQKNKWKVTEKGILSGKGKKTKVQIKPEYLKQFGQMFLIGENATDTEQKIKRGLQFYFVANLERRLGLQKSLQFCQQKAYTDLFNISIINQSKAEAYALQADVKENKENECIPQDDTFALLRFGVTDENDGKLSEVFYNIESAIGRATEEKSDLSNLWVAASGSEFSQDYFAHIVGGIFKFGYLKNGMKNDYQCVMNFVKDSCVKTIDEIKDNQEYKNRVYLLICQLFRNEFGDHNDKHGKLKLNVDKSTLENVQFIRLQWHIVGVLLSLLRNPLSTLLHNPRFFVKRYLVGMINNQGNDLMKGMINSGVWLCPNDHMYFILHLVGGQVKHQRVNYVVHQQEIK